MNCELWQIIAAFIVGGMVGVVLMCVVMMSKQGEE
jgi:hypothetical protein